MKTLLISLVAIPWTVFGGITTSGTAAAAAFNGGTVTAPITVSSGTANLLAFPPSNAPTWGSFQIGLSNLDAATGNSLDAGRTITNGVTTNGSTRISTGGSAYPNCFSNGDVGRTATLSGKIAAGSTIASIPSTTVASGSNNAALPQATIHLASVSGFTNATEKYQIKTADGTYTVVTCTGTATSGSDPRLTTCTGGTGTLVTGAKVSSITEADLSANAVGTGSSLSIAIGGRSDSPFYWGFNAASDPNYNSVDGSLQYVIEPTYTTAGGVRQIEHYIAVTGEGGDGGALGAGRIFNVEVSLYDETLLHSVGFATMRLYPNQLVIGNPNANNDIIIITPASSSSSESSMVLRNKAVIDTDGSSIDPIRLAGSKVLGFSSNQVRIYPEGADVEIGSANSYGTTTTLSFTDHTNNGTCGIRWDSSGLKMQVARFGVWGDIPKGVGVPANAGATGTAGDIAYDGSFLYICTSINTWKRVAIATW